MDNITVSLRDIDKKVDSIYEAIIIISKRAKQINNEQKKYIENELMIDPDTDDYYDDNDSKTSSNVYCDNKLEKPSKIALREFLSGKLTYEYPEKYNEE